MTKKDKRSRIMTFLPTINNNPIQTLYNFQTNETPFEL